MASSASSCWLAAADAAATSLCARFSPVGTTSAAGGAATDSSAASASSATTVVAASSRPGFPTKSFRPAPLCSRGAASLRSFPSRSTLGDAMASATASVSSTSCATVSAVFTSRLAGRVIAALAGRVIAALVSAAFSSPSKSSSNALGFGPSAGSGWPCSGWPCSGWPSSVMQFRPPHGPAHSHA